MITSTLGDILNKRNEGLRFKFPQYNSNGVILQERRKSQFSDEKRAKSCWKLFYRFALSCIITQLDLSTLSMPIVGALFNLNSADV